jgi:hypothetical protein
MGEDVLTAVALGASALQVSGDFTTLRWGWDSFVRLFYVDSILVNAEDLSIMLDLAMENNLVIKFRDAQQCVHASVADAMSSSADSRDSNGVLWTNLLTWRIRIGCSWSHLTRIKGHSALI